MDKMKPLLLLNHDTIYIIIKMLGNFSKNKVS
jgi:hypothetical protein